MPGRRRQLCGLAPGLTCAASRLASWKRPAQPPPLLAQERRQLIAAPCGRQPHKNLARGGNQGPVQRPHAHPGSPAAELGGLLHRLRPPQGDAARARAGWEPCMVQGSRSRRLCITWSPCSMLVSAVACQAGCALQALSACACSQSLSLQAACLPGTCARQVQHVWGKRQPLLPCQPPQVQGH